VRKLVCRFLAYLIGGIAGGLAVWLYARPDPITGAWRHGLAVLLAALGAVAAATLLRKASAAPANGIRTNPAWSIHATDLVCLAAAVIAMFFIVDGFSQRLGGPPAMIADPLASDVIAVMFLPAALILALFVTQSGSQSVAIDSDRLVVTGPFGAEQFAWGEIERLKPHSQYVLVSRVGVPVPRHLRTNLEVTASDGRTSTIYEPGLAGDRRAILSALGDHAPTQLQGDLAAIEAAWSAKLRF
jgi:hypothetical protein